MDRVDLVNPHQHVRLLNVEMHLLWKLAQANIK